MTTRVWSTGIVVAASLGLACFAAAQTPAKLGPTRTAALGTTIGHILGTDAWGIDVNFTDNGTPAQENAKVRKAAPKIVVIVRRYERRVAPGACHHSLRQLELAWKRGQTVTTKTATSFDRAYLVASQRVTESCQ